MPEVAGPPPAQGDTASWIFTLLFALLGGALLAVELYGVRRKGRMDTITEHWYWLADRFPWLNVIMALALVWMFCHLVLRLL